MSENSLRDRLSRDLSDFPSLESPNNSSNGEPSRDEVFARVTRKDGDGYHRRELPPAAQSAL